MHDADNFWGGPKYRSWFPTVGVPIDISVADADFTGNPLRFVYCTTAGFLSVQLVGDTQLRVFPVAANSRFEGIITKVGKAGTTSTVTMGAR